MARKNRNQVTTAAEQEELDQDTPAASTEEEEEEQQEEELEEEEQQEEEAEQVESALDAGREYTSRDTAKTGDRIWTAESRERWGADQPSLSQLLAQADRVNQTSEE